MDTRQKNVSINDLTHPADFGLLNLFLFICFFSFEKVLFLCLSLLNSTYIVVDCYSWKLSVFKASLTSILAVVSFSHEQFSDLTEKQIIIRPVERLDNGESISK